MAIEHASVQVARKPWGVADLHPWSSIDGSGDAVGELWFQRADKNAPTPACCSNCCSPASRCRSRFIRTMHLRARSASERQDRGLVHPLGNAGRAGCAGTEAAAHATGIARSDQGRLDCRSRSMASRRERRHHLRPRRHDPRHRRRYRARRDSAAQRRDIPPVRLRQAARTARRQRRRCFRCRAGSSSSRSTTPHRGSNSPDREPAFRP